MRTHGTMEEPTEFLSESRQAMMSAALGETMSDACQVMEADSHRLDAAHPFARAMGERPHSVEHAVQRQLLGHPGLKFSSLVIRRVRDGVCLEGFVEATDGLSDVCQLARTVDGVNQVLNHLVVRQSVKNKRG